MPEVTGQRLKIFLCHNSYQKPLLREVMRQLPSWLDAWIDEEELLAGEHFAPKLQNTILNKVQYVVAFYSKEAAESIWVERELSWALEREQKLGREIIIPVILGRSDTSGQAQIPRCFEGRLLLYLQDQKEESVRSMALHLVEYICRLMVRDLQTSGTWSAAPLAGYVESNQPMARFWRRRSELSIQDWKNLFSSAKDRIWLLGHSMEPSVNPEVSGYELAKRLAAGVDLRLVVLDPFSKSNYQLHEIEREISEPDLRGKIIRTLSFAESIEKLAARETNNKNYPTRFSVGLTEDVIHNSIVIVDGRFLITIYSHLYEMGNSGITMDLDLSRETEKDLCDFFKNEFLRTWRHSRPILDHKHMPLRVESRVYRHEEKARKIIKWFNGSIRELPPPLLTVIYPTYRCSYGPRSRYVESISEVPNGPYIEKFLCPNCMFGPILNKGMHDMPVERLSDLCDELINNGVQQIEIAGGGEPLHHRQISQLLEVIYSKRSANSHKVVFGLLSNVTAVSNCDYLDDLLKSFSYIRWSWPESGELSSTLSQIYLNGLQQLVQRKVDLQRQKQLVDNVRIGVKILATRDNTRGDCPSLVTLVNKLFEIDIDHIKIRPIRSRTTSADTTDLRKAEDALLRLELDLIRNGALSGNKTLEVDLRERFVQARHICRYSSLISVVEPNGNLRICWNDVTPSEDRVIGNVFLKPFERLWGSERHRKICHGTKADWVCNSEDGCHCRIVGYEDAAAKLLIDAGMPSVTSGIMVDTFI